jgi:hypothetical protein
MFSVQLSLKRGSALVNRKSANRLRILVTAIAGFPLLGAGLARAQGVVIPLPAEDQQRITAHLGSGVVGKALPGKRIEDATAYFPLHPKALTYQVTSGPHTGNSQTLGLAESRRPSGHSAWRFLLSPTLAGFIHETAEGDLMMPAVSDAGEGVVIITTPANPFLIKGMRPGESRSYTQQVAVMALDDPADQKYSGTLQGTYTYVGNYQVMVPAGTYDAVLFRLKCHGKVGPAHTKDTAYYFFAPRTGVVAMISQEDATAFWIINIDTSSGKVLTSK